MEDSGSTSAISGEAVETTPYRESTVYSPHGELHVRLSVPGSPRGIVVLAHGLAEHAGRYERLGEAARSAGYAVAAYDQHGHGSENAPAIDIDDFEYYVDDYRAVVEFVGGQLPGIPCFLFGHSMGSVVALRCAERWPDGCDGLVLSAFLGAVRNDIHPFIKGVARFASHLLPRLPVASRLEVSGLTSDPMEQLKYLQDPKVNNEVTLRWLREMLDARSRSIQLADRVAVPVLMMHGRNDPVADVSGMSLLQARLTVPCDALLYDAGHEVFNEIPSIRDAATQDLLDWLDARSAQGGSS